ncbi:DUF4190 domain-containing protein [Streptomyces sp. NPDC057623]|uniref:DUF4190 domain-containing protein n=1 Tax=Streptomyces sp. NPDC057623 TaxID=3346187 RepID=UPI0036AAB6BD
MSIPPPPGPHHPQGSPEQPQGPYAQGPYPYPYAHDPYGPYGRPVPVNGVAIGALVLGILCFVPAVGLVLGLIALAQIRKRGERGKGMAIAGCVLSSVGLALWVLGLSTGSAADFWDGFKGAARGDGTAYALAKGDCFDTPTGDLEGDAYDVDEVSCADGHDGEVFGVVTLPGGSFPGDDEIDLAASQKCYALQDGYTMDTWAVPDDVDVYYLVPSRESWRLGDREITCLLGSTAEDGELTGSLRTDPTTLDADQAAFLAATNAVDAALYKEPEEHPDDDLAASQDWAKDVHTALGEQIEALRGHSWRAGAKKPVADLIEEMEDARRQWSQAAAARDVDTYFTHYESGYEYVDGPTTVTARKALGLDTTVPKPYEDDSDGGGSGIAGVLDA